MSLWELGYIDIYNYKPVSTGVVAEVDTSCSDRANA